MLYHTGMGYEEIARRTLPQIEAILDGADENISIKMGMPSIFGGAMPSTSFENKESSQENVDGFFNDF